MSWRPIVRDNPDDADKIDVALADGQGQFIVGSIGAARAIELAAALLDKAARRLCSPGG